MAKLILSLNVPEPPSQVVTLLPDILGNYAQYFSVQQSASNILLFPRHWEGRKPLFGMPTFVIEVSSVGSASQVTLNRRLAQPGGCFFGFYTAFAALMTLLGIAILGSNPSEWHKAVPFIAVGAILTAAGLGFRQIYYRMEETRDNEVKGILQNALANLGRPRS